MSPSATQKDQVSELYTPLGQDVLLLTDYYVHEEMSRPFEIRVDAISDSDTIDFNDLLGKPACVRMNTLSGKKRYFHGIVVEGNHLGKSSINHHYSLVMRPWLWLLTQAADCRIFQNLTVKQIILKVFEDAGFTDYEDHIAEDSPSLEYCVQYQESHFNFVSRLMEAHGIFYFFKHSREKHVLVLGNDRSVHSAIPDLPEISYVGMEGRTRDNEEHVANLRRERLFRTGKVTLNSYDFKKPKTGLTVVKDATGSYQHGGLEAYDYYEKYVVGEDSTLGKDFAQARLESIKAEDKRRHCTGNAPSLFPGGVTKMKEHLDGAENIKFLVVSATHVYRGQHYSSSQTIHEGYSYSGSYLLQPEDVNYKAPQVSHVPRIYGPQTAIVVGSSGQEIYTDNYGRIKIQFPWDRIGRNDENSSCWARVAQLWSGKSWGTQFIPRIGMEVVVEFLEGDPDRPLIIGTVYNGDNPVPYPQPDNDTQSGIKTNSSRGGGGANELMFDDKKNSELVRFVAEKDLEATIKNTEAHTVLGKKLSGKGDVARKTIIHRGDDTLLISNGDSYTKIHGSQYTMITENQNLVVKGDQHVKIEQNMLVKCEDNIKIEAENSITLQVGDSRIIIKQDGIIIKAMNIAVSGDFVSVKGSANLTLKAPSLMKN